MLSFANHVHYENLPLAYVGKPIKEIRYDFSLDKNDNCCVHEETSRFSSLIDFHTKPTAKKTESVYYDIPDDSQRLHNVFVNTIADKKIEPIYDPHHASRHEKTRLESAPRFRHYYKSEPSHADAESSSLFLHDHYHTKNHSVSETLQHFTAGESDNLNLYLLKNAGLEDEHKQQYIKSNINQINLTDLKNKVLDLKQHMARLNTPHPFIIYSPISFIPTMAHPQLKKPNKDSDHITLKLPSFTSGFLDQKQAYEETPESNQNYKHIVALHIPKNSTGTYIGEHSSTPHKKEFLLPPNTIIHVHKEPSIFTEIDRHTERDVFHQNKATHYKVWHGLLIHDSNKSLLQP